MVYCTLSIELAYRCHIPAFQKVASSSNCTYFRLCIVFTTVHEDVSCAAGVENFGRIRKLTNKCWRVGLLLQNRAPGHSEETGRGCVASSQGQPGWQIYLCRTVSKFHHYYLDTYPSGLQTSIGDPWHFGADLYLWLMDPDPDATHGTTPFFNDFNNSKKYFFLHIIFL